MRKLNISKKRIVTVVAFLMFSFLINGQEQKAKLTVIVNGIDNISGTVRAGLYNKKGFLDNRINGLFKKVVSNQCTLVFENVPFGKYAIAVFQDINLNEELDKGFFGVPLEPYAFSNNKKGFMGPPSFKSVSFIFDNDKEIYIQLD